jgi:hypothetical protein
MVAVLVAVGRQLLVEMLAKYATSFGVRQSVMQPRGCTLRHNSWSRSSSADPNLPQGNVGSRHTWADQWRGTNDMTAFHPPVRFCDCLSAWPKWGII